MDLSAITLLVLDVDGVLTDGRISASRDGGDAKWFHVQDGCAIKLWQKSGGRVAILTGRESSEVKRRADELGIQFLRMGVEDKATGLRELLARAQVGANQAAYIGDDLPDAPAMTLCAFAVAPQNAVPDVKRIAQYVTRRRGGDGAVAETIELILRKQKRWRACVA